jgi:hypothetical protein
MSYVDRATCNDGLIATEILITDHEKFIGTALTSPAEFPVEREDESCRLIKINSSGVVFGYESNKTQVLARSSYIGNTDRNIALMYDNAVIAMAYCLTSDFTKAETLLNKLTEFGAPIYTAVNALSESVVDYVGYDVNDLSASTKEPLVFYFFRPRQNSALAFNFGENNLLPYDGSAIDYKATAMLVYTLGYYSHWNDGLEVQCATFADALIAYEIPTDLETAVLFYYAFMWAYVAVNDTKYKSAAVQVRNALRQMVPSGFRETAFYANFLLTDGVDATAYLNALINSSGDAGSTFIAANALARARRKNEYASMLARYPRLETNHYSNNVVDTAWHIFSLKHSNAFELLQMQSRLSKGGNPMGTVRNKSLSLGFSKP